MKEEVEMIHFYRYKDDNEKNLMEVEMEWISPVYKVG